MAFEPIELRRSIETDGTDDQLPNTIPLNRAPSREWTRYFEGMQWEMAELGPAQFPKVRAWGIAIPELSPHRLRMLLQRIAEAVEKTNAVEARRVEGQPPDTRTVYEEWFDAQAGDAAPDGA
jgi:hypothetical protein